ncbi:MAG: hypothetical protein LBK08_00585 [Treponema sp.]|jgi:hypothetical protein|nr:hypothetical protein [Treponema sp.]
MKRLLFFIKACTVCAALGALPPASGLSRDPPEKPVVSLLFAGSWEKGGNLSTRARIMLEMPASGLGFRVQYTDRRKTSSPDAFTESFDGNGLAAVSGGVYHKPTGSRFLYGMITTSGLAARITNPRLKGLPFEESRAVSQSELKTDSSSTALPAFYLRLASPELEPSSKSRIKAFGAVSLESEGEPGSTLSFSPGKGAFTAGTTVSFSRNSQVRLEAYYTEGTIPPRTPSTWFSFKPALPERDFRVYAGSVALRFPGFGLAADGAWSETFAYGRDFYGNLGLRFGDRPWRLSLAADGSGSRYVGPDGGENGAELRFAARLERRGRRSSLFRLEALARAAETEDNAPGGQMELAEKPNRYSLGLYYRPQQNGGSAALRSVSFSVKTDGRVPEKESAGVEALVSLRLFRLGLDSRIGVSGLEENPGGNDEAYRAFPGTLRLGSYRFDSFRLRESLVWSKDFFQCRAGFGYTAEMKSAGLTTFRDASLALTFKGKHGWFSFKISSPKFPDDWEYTLSWLIRK